MKALKGTRTHDNLKARSPAIEANRRYLYSPPRRRRRPERRLGAVRSTAEGETGHAHGHLEYLEAVGRSGDQPARSGARATT